MARAVRKRYVVRLHPVVMTQITEMAEKAGYLPATYISNILEINTPDRWKYEIYDREGDFQLKRGPGNTNAKQTSVYLSDKTYNAIGKISENLMENVDKNMTPTFVIRDILTRWLDENG
ncbi:MAG: hypothetical protein IJN77_07415 [Oscillospiraceae bacterium]|nr:hypothetical protein [Oscillospiraceae bacterium]